MPKYTYKCATCAKKTEILCPFSAKKELEKTLTCEHCSGTDLFEQYGAKVVGSGSASTCESGTCCGGTCGTCD
jgi:predicted nucleic acid-binding Zn ribbon protein